MACAETDPAPAEAAMRMPLQLTVAALAFAACLPAQTTAPEIAYDSIPDLLKTPDRMPLGEAAGVATDSKGNIFVYTRTGSGNATIGGSRIFTHAGSPPYPFSPPPQISP